MKLDGEELLETMHAHGNRDSLVYWLEFKNDDEFPARFGSIAGGSAFKFGIFRSKETGTWVTGSPIDVKELTVPEAVDIARKHRDQLVKGVERIGILPDLADDAEYRKLQEDLDRIAPRSATSPGVTSTSACCPREARRLPQPRLPAVLPHQDAPGPPGGRWALPVAGRYVAAAHELGIPINHLTTILNHQFPAPVGYWRIGTSNGEQPRNRWQLMRDGGCVAIGWADLGDLSGYEKDAPSKEKLIKLLGDDIREPPADRQDDDPDPQFRQGNR